MNSIEDRIDKLKLSKNINKIFKENNLQIIKDIWVLNRKKLKELKLTDKEINEVIIALQLEGLDLNKRIYD